MLLNYETSAGLLVESYRSGHPYRAESSVRNVLTHRVGDQEPRLWICQRLPHLIASEFALIHDPRFILRGPMYGDLGFLFGEEPSLGGRVGQDEDKENAVGNSHGSEYDEE